MDRHPLGTKTVSLSEIYSRLALFLIFMGLGVQIHVWDDHNQQSVK